MTRALIQNVLGADLPTIDRGEGVWLWDAAGKDYIDGCSGAVVAAIGHAHPRVVEAAARQIATVSFTHRGAFTSEPLERVAEMLTAMTGYAGAWFVSSGSEAVEAAMQFALQYHRERQESERTVFLSAVRGYHGNTLGALSASGHARRATVEHLALDIPALPSPYAFREQGDRTDAEYTKDMLAAARLEFERHRGTIAAIMIEPVSGATLAAVTPPPGYLAGLKALCEEFGALFIADEVMTGLGRTGAVLATGHDDVVADLVALGKSLGAGYTPIAATLVAGHVLDTIENGSGRILGGHTYGGNPLSMAIAEAVLTVIDDEHVIERGRSAAVRLRAGLDELASRHPIVVDVRGVGLLLGLEFAADAAAVQGSTAARIAAACMRNGVIIYPTTGGYIDAAQVAPPLTISDDELDELLRRLDDALTEVERDQR